ncbi:iron-sulfur cluster repair di-iron protein [Bacillus horti]|uniref:Regulator of cell morphogenesis and NO signaling n=1 Tax=Caldalkalibacillus horti TaxID=77523 RepID=A0ABT9VY28_9BACI|nr:iron-sulfur cluster repair di-iron protein [Bacillus horti]MDQ0165894.1 regulator of cell morphogenesis and NO signaling [Bacillus horti]
MKQTFSGSQTIAQIVTDFPHAANLFKEFKIDFCCGGQQSLTKALEQKGLDEETFIQKLRTSYEEEKKRGEQQLTMWKLVPSDKLIDHIVHTHHGYLRQELPVLSSFITKVSRVHGEAHPELIELNLLFHQMKVELEQHLIEEEEILFPLIKRKDGQAFSPSEKSLFEKAETEHSTVGEILQKMRSITQDYTLPEGACGTYTLSFQKLELLEADIFQHVHLENNILFTRFTQ